MAKYWPPLVMFDIVAEHISMAYGRSSERVERHETFVMGLGVGGVMNEYLCIYACIQVHMS